MNRFLAALGMLCAAALGGQAQGASVAILCPIDGKKFQHETAPPAASPQRYLDMKPVEPANAPWPLPQCPGNGFVVYKVEFTESEVVKLREFVASDNYRALIAVHTNHYLAAVLRRAAGDPQYDVAWALAQASWGVSKDPARYRQYAEEALAAFDALPDGRFLDRRQHTLREMLSGELERRLGRFDAAEKRFRRIRDAAEFTQPQLQQVITLQLKLINAKDSGIHLMPAGR